MSLEKKRQPSGKSYFYIWKPSLWYALFFFALGFPILGLTFMNLATKPLLSTFVGLFVSITFTAMGFYTIFCEGHVDFDGESQVLGQRFYLGGKLIGETKHSFSVFHSVRIVEKPLPRPRGGHYFGSYVIALAHDGQDLLLFGRAFCREQHRERREIIAKVLGLP